MLKSKVSSGLAQGRVGEKSVKRSLGLAEMRKVSNVEGKVSKKSVKRSLGLAEMRKVSKVEAEVSKVSKVE